MAVAVQTPRPKVQKKQHGLAFWMERVLEECDRASADFAADPVHDLRVALRRCRSMADGLMAMDPDPAWKKMKKAGKDLFSKLGELRDVQVMREWVQKLGAPDDLVTARLVQYASVREAEFKREAAQALQAFDRNEWKKWAKELPRRSVRVRTGSPIFKHLALERWTEAHALHSRALRSGSQVAWHSLRIGIKRFRYIVENFLPVQHEEWIVDLKALQDLLGEVHDLDVLWFAALEINVFPDPASRSLWHAKVVDERDHRIQSYRHKTMGRDSLWQHWRAELPKGSDIQTAALARLRLWASFLDPDFKHSVHVARLAVRLYDSIPLKRPADSDERAILQIAALLHDVGLSKKQKDHQKTTYRLVQKLHPPLGFSAEKLRLAAAVARYHRGALPHAGQRAFTGLTSAERQTVLRLAGVLRVANAFDSDHSGSIRRIQLHEDGRILVISAEGYNSRSRIAQDIAAARHLLETVLRRPIMIKPLVVRKPRPQARRMAA
ncbi:MAG TPA: CHAD domain-containing protein [Terriglobales bacterium]|nr:CHAD domain-containing protein [Terriglobales bacterium]